MYMSDATIKIKDISTRIFENVVGFEWDTGNKSKNFIKHSIIDEECEEVFFDHDKKILRDILHSGTEDRYILIGKTKKHRLVFIAFTIRKNKVRIISARDLNKREYKLYEKN